MIYAVHKRTKEHRIVPRFDVLSNADWRYIQADADGWIEWSGGECPLPENSEFEYKLGFDCKQAFGRVSTGHVHWKHLGKPDDIVAYRPILEPQADQAKEWDGKGLPPVGTVCEYEHEEQGNWVEVRVVGDDNGVRLFAFNEHAYHGSNRAHDFRPIRTDRERWIEKAEKLLSQCSDDEPLSYLCALTYDAIASGDLPMPEVKK